MKWVCTQTQIGFYHTKDANTTALPAGTEALVVGYQVWTTLMWMAFLGHYFYSGTHLVVHQRCFLYSPLLTWFFVVSPPSLTLVFHRFKKCIRVNNTLFNFATSQKRDFYENGHFHSLFNLWLGPVSEKQPSTRAHGWRERLKISKEDQFERDLLKTAKDVTPQKVAEF